MDRRHPRVQQARAQQRVQRTSRIATITGLSAIAGALLARQLGDSVLASIELGHVAATNLTCSQAMLSVAAGCLLTTLGTKPASRRSTRPRRTARVSVPARYDAVTGVRNRPALLDYLIADSAQDNVSEETSVLVVRLDRLPAIIAAHSPEAGDRVLATLAERLRALVEPMGAVGRIDGGEFGCIVHHAIGSDLPALLSTKILTAIAEPIDVRGGTVNPNVAIGIASCPRGAQSAEETFAAARAAAACSQKPGVSTCTLYEGAPALAPAPVAAATAAPVSSPSIEDEIRAGLAAGAFVPLYRAIVDPRSGLTLGFECRASWHHPTRGLLGSETFLPDADAAGLTGAIGLALLRQACADAALWPRHQQLWFALSSLQLNEAEVAQGVLEILASSGLAPERLVLQITGAAPFRDVVAARAILVAIARAGVQVAFEEPGSHAPVRISPPVAKRPAPALSIAWPEPVARRA